MRIFLRIWVGAFLLVILLIDFLIPMGITSHLIVDGRLQNSKMKIGENVLAASRATYILRQTRGSIAEIESVKNAENVTQEKQHNCDDSLWRKVYKSERLLVHGRCVSVTGIIVDATHGKRSQGVRREQDGDCHGWLKLDAGQEKYINAGNVSDEEGNLVFEIVCMFPVKQTDAISACNGYANKVKLPPAGSHVRMTGSWVQDDNHAKWNELHPVSSIEIVSK